MSDFEDDIDDQLLELAGATEKKKKRRQPSGGSGGAGASGAGGKSASKKRKAERMEMDTESEKEPVESEDEMEDPFPLEGKYKDEADRRELLSMTEIRREEILSERDEEKQRLKNQRAISDMVKQQQRGGASGAGDDSVSRAAKRQHTARGATKEKAQRLDELKAKRKAKDDKKRTKVNESPSQRQERSSSPQDMDISDSESEDGQISKMELEEERLNNFISGHEPRSKKGGRGGKDDADTAPVDVQCTLADLEECRLTRDKLVKHCEKPWFQDYVTGAWVRFLIGQENGQAVYRICEIKNLAPDLVKPYKIDDKLVNQALELKHGKSVKIWNMDKVSNGAFLEKEFDRLVRTCSTEDVKLPTKRSLEAKLAQMQKLITQPMTEGDISAMLKRKSQLQINKPTGMTTMERSRLNQALTLASRRQDWAEVEEIKAKLAEEAKRTPEPARNESIDMLAKVNERNRKANMEAVRKAELAETERKRRDRKLAAQNGGVVTPSDPSARLRTVPRMFNSNTPTTRPGTPVVNTTAPIADPLASKAVVSGSSFEATLIDSLEIDLGDF
ncbi:hypothetical protein B0H34DRAFT_722097 [Crassisporium funariophilum]|nr:hypothetical protein B0H34DRAFT_722097 [Crassisporium funariophilum]